MCPLSDIFTLFRPQSRICKMGWHGRVKKLKRRTLGPEQKCELALLRKRLLSRTRRRRASWGSAARDARTGSWGGTGWGSGRTPRSRAPGLTKVSNSPFANSSYLGLEPQKASFCSNLEKRPSNIVSGCRPLAQLPVPPAAASARVPRSLAWPGLAARAQASRARPRLPGSRLPACRR